MGEPGLGAGCEGGGDRGVVVRRGTGADADAIVGMMRSMLAMHAVMNAWRYATREDPGDAFRRAMRGDGERALLWLIAERARAGGGAEVGGYLMAELEAEDALLWMPASVVVHDVYVEASWRGAGVGRRLMDGAMAWARERGAGQVRLYTDAGNAAARACFGAMGFVETMREMSVRVGL